MESESYKILKSDKSRKKVKGFLLTAVLIRCGMGAFEKIKHNSGTCGIRPLLGLTYSGLTNVLPSLEELSCV